MKRTVAVVCLVSVMSAFAPLFVFSDEPVSPSATSTNDPDWKKLYEEQKQINEDQKKRNAGHQQRSLYHSANSESSAHGDVHLCGDARAAREICYFNQKSPVCGAFTLNLGSNTP